MKQLPVLCLARLFLFVQNISVKDKQRAENICKITLSTQL